MGLLNLAVTASLTPALEHSGVHMRTQGRDDASVYAAIMDGYRDRSFEHALDALLEWWNAGGEAARRERADWLRRYQDAAAARRDPRLVTGAALHADAAARLATHAHVDAALEQFRIAQRLIELAAFSGLLTSSTADLPRLVALAELYVLQGALRLDMLAQRFEAMRRHHADDPDMLRVKGSLEEARLLAVARGPGRERYWETRAPSDWKDRRRVPELERAERAYLQSLARDPGDAETLVRLGRVQYLQGDFPSACMTLRRSLAGEASSTVRYWAWLFLGAAEQAQNRTESAAAAYRAALEIVPNAQSALLALGASRAVAGDWTNARRTLESITSASYDPWWLYAFGQSHRLADTVARIRSSLQDRGSPE